MAGMPSENISIIYNVAALPCLLAPPKFPRPTTQRCVTAIGQLFSTAALINVRTMPLVASAAVKGELFIKRTLWDVPVPNRSDSA